MDLNSSLLEWMIFEKMKDEVLLIFGELNFDDGSFRFYYRNFSFNML